MNHPINVILFGCRDRINAELKKNAGETGLVITILEDEAGLMNLVSSSKYYILVHDGTDRRRVRNVFDKIKNRNVVLLFLLSAAEARKFNYKKNYHERIFYFSMPQRLWELSRLMEIIYKSRRLDVASKEYEDILKAYEQAGELSRSELINIKESLAAWEKVAELSRSELLEYSREKEAYDALIDFINNENLFKDKVLKAWEQAMEMGREELMKAYQEIKKHIDEKEALKKEVPPGPLPPPEK